MRRIILTAIALAGLSLCSARANLTADFNTDPGGSVLPLNYQGFTWEGENGGQWAWKSGGYVEPTGTVNGAVTVTLGGSVFNFDYADFAAVPDTSGATVTITGYRGGTFLGSMTTPELTAIWSRIPLVGNSPLTGVDKLVFTGNNWRMDNFVDGPIVPEPSTYIAGILLLLPFGVSTMRALRKNRAV